MLELKNVTKEFESVIAVNNISFKLNNGTVLGIVGRNGARKIYHFQNDSKLGRAYNRAYNL